MHRACRGRGTGPIVDFYQVLVLFLVCFFEALFSRGFNRFRGVFQQPNWGVLCVPFLLLGKKAAMREGLGAHVGPARGTATFVWLKENVVLSKIGFLRSW